MKTIFKLILLLISLLISFVSGAIWFGYQVTPNINIDKSKIISDPNIKIIDDLIFSGNKCKLSENSIYWILKQKGPKNISQGSRHIFDFVGGIKNMQKYMGTNILLMIANTIGITNINFNNEKICNENYLYLKLEELENQNYGNNIYKYQEASNYYFNKNITGLSLCESIGLYIVIPKSPKSYTSGNKINDLGSKNIYNYLLKAQEYKLIATGQIQKELEICNIQLP